MPLFVRVAALLALLWTVSSELQAQNSPTFTLRSTEATLGDTVLMDLTVRNFSDLFAFQFVISWADEDLEFVELVNSGLPEFGSNNYSIGGSYPNADKDLRIVWFDNSLEGASIPDDGTLFTFKAVVSSDADPKDIAIQVGNSLHEDFTTEVINAAEQILPGIFTQATVAVDRTLPPRLDLTMDLDVIDGCPGQLIEQVTALPLGGTPPYTYSWSGPVGFQSDSSAVLLREKGLYTLVASDEAGNRSTIFVYQEQDPTNTEEALIVDIESRPTSCAENTGSLQVIPNGNPEDFSFHWSTGATTSLADSLAAGTYTVTVTFKAGICSAVLSAEVEESGDIAPNFQTDTVDCANDAPADIFITNLSPSAYTFLWDNGDTTSFTQVTTPGVYQVQITERSTSCTDTAQVEVVSNSPEDFIQLSLDCPPNYCAETIPSLTVETATGVAPFVINWNTGTSDTTESGRSTIDIQPGQYRVTVTDANGCQGIAARTFQGCFQEGVELNKFRLYVTEVDTPDQRALLNAELFNGGTPPYVYQWSTGKRDTTYFASSIPYPDVLHSEDTLTSVSVTDATGAQFQRSFTQTDRYGQGDSSNTLTLLAEHTIVAPGEPFSYRLYAIDAQKVSQATYTIDWDPCLLNTDSVRAYRYDTDETSTTYREDIDELGTYEVVVGAIPDSAVLPDTLLIAEFFFSAQEHAAGISPFLFQVNQPVELAEGGPAFLRPVHGSITVSSDSNLVLPGDANTNGIVDHFDALMLGFGYLQEGPNRRRQISDTVEFGLPWPENTPSSGINFRHLDGNGDGFIDDQDLTVIQQHFSDSSAAAPQLDTTVSSAYTLTFAEDSLQAGASNEVPILLQSSAFPDRSVYGISLSVKYPPDVDPSTLQVSFAQNSLAVAGEPPVYFVHNDEQTRRLYLTVIRTDGQDIPAGGPVARLQFDLAEGADSLASFRFGPVQLIDASEQLIELEVRDADLGVRPNVTSTLNRPNLLEQITIYPVPARQFLYLNTGKLQVQQVDLLAGNGQRIRAASIADNRIAVGDLQPGLYLLRVVSSAGVVIRKWMKQ